MNDPLCITILYAPLKGAITPEFIKKNKKYFVLCNEERIIVNHCRNHIFQISSSPPGWIILKTKGKE